MGPCPICGTGWGGLHHTLSVFLYRGQCCCVCCNEWYCSRTNGWLSTQLHGGHFCIFFLLMYIHYLWLILNYLCITKSQPLGQCWLSKESDALTYVHLFQVVLHPAIG